MSKHARLALTILLGGLAPLACTSGEGGGSPGAAGTSAATGAAGTSAATGAAGTSAATGAAGTSAATGAAGTSAATGAAGTSAATGAAGTSAATGAAGTSAATGAAGTGSAGRGGAGTGGAGTGAAGTGAGTAGTGVAAGDTPPWRALNVTAAPGIHSHQSGQGAAPLNSAGIDNTGNRKMAGKLIVNLGVDSGNYAPWLGRRGFHSIGLSFFHCGHIDAWGAPYGASYHMNCRFTTFDGMQRGGAENDANAAVTATNNMVYKIKTGLTNLHAMYPEEDWGYFLNQDGTVRWSDVGFTGYSHGAQTAAALAHLVRLWRAVSRSGPRDNNCGSGQIGTPCPPNPASLPYNANCAAAGIAAWQDLPFVTPVERVYSFAGNQDGQYGDDQFSTFHMRYRGEVVSIDNNVKVVGSNRFCANAGHGGFDSGYDYAIDEAFGTPMENRKP